MSSSSTSASGNSHTPARRRRVAVIGMVAAALLPVIAIILLLTIDLGRFKESWTGAATAALERELRIEGALSIRVGRNVAISATEVVIANADWAGDAPLMRIGTLVAELDTVSLFARALKFRRIEIADVDVELVENAAGEANWELEGEPADLSGVSFVFENVILTDFVASLASPALTDTLVLRVASLEHTIRDDRLVDRIDGTINETQLSVGGSIGPRSSILAGGPATFDYTGRLGILAPREPLVEFSLTGPDAQYLFRLLNLPESARGALELEGRLGRVADRIEFAARGQVGEFSFDTDGWASDLRTLGDAEMAIEAAGPDLDRVAGVFGIEGLPGAAFKINGEARKSNNEVDVDSLTLTVGGSKIELQGRIPRFPGIVDTELAITASGDDISLFGDLPSWPYTASARGVYTDERIRFSEAVVTIGGARMGFAGDVAPAGKDLRIDLTIDAGVPDLEAFLSGFGVEGAPALPTDISARVEHGGDETRISDIDGHLGDLEFTGSLGLQGSGEELTAVVDAALRAPRLDRLLTARPAFAPAAVPVDAQIAASMSGSRLELTSVNATLGEGPISPPSATASASRSRPCRLTSKAVSPAHPMRGR
ncbi:MAG: AsmA family protein [Woeseiaceae bacterium]